MQLNVYANSQFMSVLAYRQE